MCRLCAGAMEVVGAMLLLWAIACTPSRAVAKTQSPAAGPPAEGPIADDDYFSYLDDADMSLEVEEAERFTNLPLSVFRKIYRSRTTTKLVSTWIFKCSYLLERLGLSPAC
jgi:hypothetical protein